MAVDRVARDRIAGAIVSYMRGEVDNFHLDEAIFSETSTDDAVREIGTGLWFLYDDLKSHPVSVSLEGWEALRRTVAFLKSDLASLPAVDEPHRPADVVMGLLSLMTIVTALWLSLRHSPWWMLLPGCVVGVPWIIRSTVDDDIGRDGGARAAFYPFVDEKQWREHEQLVSNAGIPEYDPVLHNRPIRTPWLANLTILPGTILTVLFLAPIFWLILSLPVSSRRR